MNLFPSLAQLPDVPGAGMVRTGGYAQELLIVLGAILVVCIGALFWFRFARTQRSHRHRHHHHHAADPFPADSPPQPDPEAESTESFAGEEEDTDEEGGRSSRRRRKRRDHRGRNPTLAETGGLPPPRPEGTPPTAP